MKGIIFLLFTVTCFSLNCTTVATSAAKGVVKHRMDEGTRDFEMTTYVKPGSSGVFLEDGAFKIQIIYFGINRLNGIYSIKAEAVNISGKKSKFDPDLIELEGIDTGVKYRSAIKGQVNQSVMLDPGKKHQFFLSYYGEALKPPASEVKLSFRRASISLIGIPEKLVHY